MSLLGKKPYVQIVFDSLTSDQLSELSNLLNSPGTPITLSLWNHEHMLTEANRGVHYVSFSFNPVSKEYYTGFLCYSSTQCGLFTFSNGFEPMNIYKIANGKFERVNEDLTVSEFRSELDDAMDTTTGGAITASSVNGVMEGSDFIIVDLNETSEKVKVDLDTDFQPHVVELTGTSGTLSEEDYLKLCGPTSSYTAQILLDEEFYISASESEDFDTYAHVGMLNSVSELKIITIHKIDEMRGEWTLTSEMVGGSTLYKHAVSLNDGKGHVYYYSNDSTPLTELSSTDFMNEICHTEEKISSARFVEFGSNRNGLIMWGYDQSGSYGTIYYIDSSSPSISSVTVRSFEIEHVDENIVTQL